MWSDQELVEVLRSSVPYCLVVALPLLLLLSPVPVDAAAEFTVFRLQQYDLHGSAHGEEPLCLGACCSRICSEYLWLCFFIDFFFNSRITPSSF